MSENIEQAVREVARFLANDPTHVTGQNIRHARIIVAIVERNLTPLALDAATARANFPTCDRALRSNWVALATPRK